MQCHGASANPCHKKATVTSGRHLSARELVGRLSNVEKLDALETGVEHSLTKEVARVRFLS